MVLEVYLFVIVFTPVLLVILITFLIKLCHSYAVNERFLKFKHVPFHISL